MPRGARGLADGGIYHVINRGNGRQGVFHKPEDFAAFVEILDQAKVRHPVGVLAFCVMSNHFHLLVQPESGPDLSRFMQWFLTSHVRRYHRHYKGSGHVWQGRFRSFLVQEDNHLLTVARYVGRNPLRAGMVASSKDWFWSSHGETSGALGRSISRPLPVPVPGNWSDFVAAAQTPQEVEALQRCIDRQSPFGDAGWQERVSKALGLESTLRPRGRPRKQPKK